MSEDQILQNIGNAKRLFLDPSSNCMGYAIASFEKRTCTIHRAGCIWFGTEKNTDGKKVDWPHGKKYHYVQQLIMNDFYIYEAITDIIYERYSFDPKNSRGCLVVPEMIGAIKASCYDLDMALPLGCEDISPQEWRKHIGLQPDKTPKVDKDGNPDLTKAGKPRYNRDYKAPCIRLIDDMFPGKVPKRIISNITGNDRATPHDVYDAVALCIGWHKKLGMTQFILADNAFGGGVDDCVD